MRIAYVVGAFPSRSETFIAREIAALEAQGVTVEVFPLWRDRDAAAPAPDERVHRCGWLCLRAQFAHLGAGARWQLYFLSQLRRQGRGALQAVWRLNTAVGMGHRMLGLGVERVHAQFASAPSTAGWVAASVAGVPFSFAVHARDVFIEPQFLAAKARAADRIVACNSAAAARVRELIEAGDRPKVRLIHHGLPVAEYPFRERVPRGAPLVLGVGRLVEKKGFIHLVRAVDRLRKRGQGVTCWLVGDGPQRDALEQEVAALGLSDAVILKGWTPPDGVRAAYERASVMAVPSVMAADGDLDGLPNVVLEAAAIGVPLVTTSVGGLGDLARDGQTALVADPGSPIDLAERIQAVLTDADGAMARARNARAEVEARFDVAACTARLLDVLAGA